MLCASFAINLSFSHFAVCGLSLDAFETVLDRLVEYKFMDSLLDFACFQEPYVTDNDVVVKEQCRQWIVYHGIRCAQHTGRRTQTTAVSMLAGHFVVDVTACDYGLMTVFLFGNRHLALLNLHMPSGNDVDEYYMACSQVYAFIDGLVRKCVIRKQPRPLFMLAADANTSMGLSTDGAHWCPDGVRLHPNTLKREAWCELVRQSDTYVIFTSAKKPKHTHTSFSSGQQQQLDHIAIPTSAASSTFHWMINDDIKGSTVSDHEVLVGQCNLVQSMGAKHAEKLLKLLIPKAWRPDEQFAERLDALGINATSDIDGFNEIIALADNRHSVLFANVPEVENIPSPPPPMQQFIQHAVDTNELVDLDSDTSAEDGSHCEGAAGDKRCEYCNKFIGSSTVKYQSCQMIVASVKCIHAKHAVCNRCVGGAPHFWAGYQEGLERGGKKGIEQWIRVSRRARISAAAAG